MVWKEFLNDVLVCICYRLPEGLVKSLPLLKEGFLRDSNHSGFPRIIKRRDDLPLHVLIDTSCAFRHLSFDRLLHTYSLPHAVADLINKSVKWLHAVTRFSSPGILQHHFPLRIGNFFDHFIKPVDGILNILVASVSHLIHVCHEGCPWKFLLWVD